MSKRFSLGRLDARKADILLPGDTISARHAEIYVDSRGSLLISDLGSSNGTAIIRSGKTLSVSSGTIALLPSDIVSLGGNKFSVDELLAKQPAASAPAHKASSSDRASVPGQKMIRCSSCGSVTPQGSPCVECGYFG